MRFVSPDLSALVNFPAIESVDFAEIRSDRNDFLVEALRQHGISYDVTDLTTDPLIIAFSQGGGANELQIRNRINNAVRALSLATTGDGDIEHIAATYYGISRQSEVQDDGTILIEDLERFRARIVLAPEAFSTAGPLGAYIFHALELDGTLDIADAYAFSEEDGASYSAGLFSGTTAYSDNQAVLAPEVLLVVLPALSYGDADQALLDRAYAAVTARDVRPIGDKVTVEPAEVVDYEVDMTIAYQRGADPAPLIAIARQRVEAYVAARRRVGLTAERLGIGGCGYVTNVESVTLTLPVDDVAGGSKQAPNCTKITVRSVQAEATWEN